MPQFNQDFITDLAKRRVVLFLGSGVSASALTRGGKRVRDWKSFLAYAVGRVDDQTTRTIIEEKIAENDLLIACEIIKQSIDPDDWKALLYDEFSQIAEPSSLHKAIVALEQRIILTTNFDKMIEDTFPSVNVFAHNHPQLINKIDANIFQILRDDRNYIVKIHGSIDEPNNMIFSRADYIQNAFGNRIYNDFIETILASYTVLFIGFSMNDPAIALLVEKFVQKYPNLRPHYIFQQEPVDKSIEDISKRLRRLHPIKYAAGKDHEDLPTQLDELRKLSEKRRKELIAESTLKAVVKF